MTPEHKKKISEALKGRMPKFIPDNKGRAVSLEQRVAISNTLKAKGIKPPSRKGYRKENALVRTPGYKAFLEKRRNLRKRLAGGSHTFNDWQQLKKSVDYTCQKCLKREPEIKLTEDHIIPISQGGTNFITNIQPLCLHCNMVKYEKTEVWINGELQ